jgi:hypothetical protein
LALLRSGKVTKFARALMDTAAFVAGSRELNLGDELTIDRPQSPELGLIRADERPALSIAYRADARSVKVGRPGGGYYRIRMYPAEWAAANPMLQAWWATLTALYGVSASILGFRESRAKAKIDETE